MTTLPTLTELTSTQIESAAAMVPPDRPIVMLNLLRYRKPVGKERYFGAYIPAFSAVAAAVGKSKDFRAVFIGSVVAQLLVASGEAWDDVALIEYSSFAAFRAIVESDAYVHDADPHRRAALEDWRFIALVQASLPAESTT